MKFFPVAFLLLLSGGALAEPYQYDLMLQGGHLIDPRNGVSAVRDLAIRDGKVAAVAPKLDPASAFKTIDVSGLYVTPGLIDIHVHAYAGTGERASFAGDLSVYPDGYTIRCGVTTAADAGSSGWRNFEDFQDRVISRARTRMFAFLNIVGQGMRGVSFEHEADDMDPKAAAEMALKHKAVIVGIKTAHYPRLDFTAVDRALEAGKLAGIPVMVDFGRSGPNKTLEELLTKKLRPGDIYTHVFSGLRGELDASGRANRALLEGRERGVIFDLGHGGGSFTWQVAVPIIREGFLPDSISTDLHVSSANSSMKNMLHIMSKLLAIGVPLDEVILRSTWNPAREIHQEQLGHLSVGAIADIAVLNLEKGRYGYLDVYGARLDGDQKLSCEMTLRDGRVIYEQNGLARPEWTTLPKNYRFTGDRRWEGGRRPAIPPAMARPPARNAKPDSTPAPKQP